MLLEFESSVDKGNAASRTESELRRPPRPLYGIWRAMRPFDAKEADLKASGEDIDIRTAYDSSQCSRRLSDFRCLRSVSACDPRKKTTDWI